MKPKIRTTGCFMEYQGKFVILHRHPGKSQGATWGLVAGKVDEGESDVQAMLREIKEETGSEAKEEELELLGEWTWEFEDKIVVFPTFRLKLNEKIHVRLDSAQHTEMSWVTPEECAARKDLVHGLHELLEKVYGQ